MIEKGSILYDVGSDHGLLPCFLLLEGICEKAYANDNKKGPLNRAITNINKYHLEDKIIPILADGLDGIKDDVDAISISGMGYYTVEKILDRADLSRFKYIVVQCNSDVNLLRKYISDHNYKIIDEEIVYDDFYYEIIKFNNENALSLNKLEIEYGPILLKKKDKIFKDYLEYKLNHYKLINNKSKTSKYNDRIEEIDFILKN